MSSSVFSFVSTSAFQVLKPRLLLFSAGRRPPPAQHRRDAAPPRPQQVGRRLRTIELFDNVNEIVFAEVRRSVPLQRRAQRIAPVAAPLLGPPLDVGVFD